MLKRLALTLLSGAFLFVCVATALAQSTTASISGTVTDERQAVVANAKVTLKTWTRVLPAPSNPNQPQHRQFVPLCGRYQPAGAECLYRDCRRHV
jgi:hypothetical protein